MKLDKSLKIQYRDPAKLTPNPYNARRHPERQREVLRVALGDEGWIDPVIFNKRTGRLVDGHARVEEAICQGVAEVPVLEIDVDEPTERKILLRHDRIGALAEIDLSALTIVLADVDGSERIKLGWNDLDLSFPLTDPVPDVNANQKWPSLKLEIPPRAWVLAKVEILEKLQSIIDEYGMKMDIKNE